MGPDAIAAMEARLLAVERRCVRLEDDTRQLARGLNLSRQRTWESWTDWRARPPAAPTTPATFIFTLRGCNSVGLVGETVTIKDAASGAVIGTATTGTSGQVVVTANVTGSSQSVLVTTSVSRFVGSSSSKTLAPGGNAALTVTLTPDTGYTCFENCGRPVATTLTMTSSLYGAFTVTLSGTLWTISTTVNYAGHTGGTNCVAKTNVPVTWTLSTAGNMTEVWPCVNATIGCPDPAGGNTCGSAAKSSVVCPPSFVGNYIGNSLLNSSNTTTHTLTWTE